MWYNDIIVSVVQKWQNNDKSAKHVRFNQTQWCNDEAFWNLIILAMLIQRYEIRYLVKIRNKVFFVSCITVIVNFVNTI